MTRTAVVGLPALLYGLLVLYVNNQVVTNRLQHLLHPGGRNGFWVIFHCSRLIGIIYGGFSNTGGVGQHRLDTNRTGRSTRIAGTKVGRQVARFGTESPHARMRFGIDRVCL